MKAPCFALITLLLLALFAPPSLGEVKPNIVLILADDLGSADLGYRGGEAWTPNIDRLAREGVRLDAFYGQQLCSPARAALMTGRYPMRYGLQSLYIMPGHRYGLPTDERTIPEALREAGYQTYMVGKWHLGHGERQYWPQNRGFDHFYGNLLGMVDYYTHDGGGVVDWQRNGQFIQEPGYHTELIAAEAVRLIQRQDRNRPFFLYFAPLAPHAPYQVPQAELKRYASMPEGERRTYLAMVSALDRAVGRLARALDETGLRRNTLILFASDNGGLGPSAQGPARNFPFRGGKGELHEGGVRVPAFANWPGKLKPSIIDEPAHMVDIMPTLLALSGGKVNPARPLDGQDLWPLLAEGKAVPREEILINVEASGGALRKDGWKLVMPTLQPGRAQLFDLAHDVGETANLARLYPEIAADLQTRLLIYASWQKPSAALKANNPILPQAPEGFMFDVGLGWEVFSGSPAAAKVR